jgi:cytochrome c oxidase subunit 4
MIVRFVGAYLALIALLALTVGSSFLPLGFGNTLVNLAIAFAKAGVILVAFMGLRRGEPLLRLVAAVAGLWLLILFGLSWVDLRGV